MSTFDTFLALHQGPKPLLIANIWDAYSAKIVEQCNVSAIATSSAAVANTFGYEDGEQLPFEQVVGLAKRLVQVVKIPVSVDIEGGYSRTATGIFDNIRKLHDAGVVGVNIEDTLPGTERGLQDAAAFQKTLTALSDLLSKNNLKVFLNIRTDAYLLGLPDALKETLARIAAYASCGVHGIFVPCITEITEIREVVSATSLPVNVLSMPALPDFAKLETAGVKRISLGSSLYRAANAFIESKVKRVISDGSVKALF